MSGLPGLAGGMGYTAKRNQRQHLRNSINPEEFSNLGRKQNLEHADQRSQAGEVRSLRQ